MQLAAAALLAGGILALPLDVVLRFRVLGYNARLSHLLFGLFLLVVLWDARAGQWRSIRLPRAALVFLVAVFASVPGSLDPVKTGGYAAWAFFDVAVFLAALPLALRLYPALGTAAVATHLLAAAAIGEVAFAEIAALFDGGPRPLSAFIGSAAFPRLQALSYEPAYLAFFLIPAVVVALTLLLLRVGPRSALMFVAILSTAVVILSTARSGWLAVAAAYGGAVVLALWHLSRRAVAVPASGAERRAAVRDAGLLLASSILVAGVILTAFAATKASGGPVERAQAVVTLAEQLAHFGAAQGTGNDVELRTSWTSLGLRAWLDHPLFGVGIGGFGAYVVHQGYTPAIPDPSKIVVPNMWIELLAETGIAGAGAALVLIVFTGARAVRMVAMRPVAAAYGLGILVLGLVSLQFNSTFTRLDLWLPLGLTYALSTSRSNE